MIPTANLHPQRRRLNQPVPAACAESQKENPPTILPRGARCLYAGAFRIQTRSRAVPRQINVVPAREAIAAPKNKKIPTALTPRDESLRTTISTSGVMATPTSVDYKPEHKRTELGQPSSHCCKR